MATVEIPQQMRQGFLSRRDGEFSAKSCFGTCTPNKRLTDPRGRLRIDGLGTRKIDGGLHLAQRRLVGLARQ